MQRELCDMHSQAAAQATRCGEHAKTKQEAAEQGHTPPTRSHLQAQGARTMHSWGPGGLETRMDTEPQHMEPLYWFRGLSALEM